MTAVAGKGGAGRRHPDPDDDQPATAAGVCDDETMIVPTPTAAAPELAWSRDDGNVWAYPAAPWWDKLRQRITDFFHPFPDEARVAEMDDYDDTVGDADDADDDVSSRSRFPMRRGRLACRGLT
ncbi:hypothetical protein [Mycobacterium avium]|uniref:hypothetical protein n=2 Tax=Mycobacterium avium TaxID=1764 RepID=UPI0004F815F1|nr:hypothetical protein [Mycobacterium avium]